MTRLSIREKLLAVDTALASAGLSHAFGGAIALAYWAEPRATMDLDVNVFVPESEAARVVATLLPLGCRFDTDSVIASVTRDGQVRVHWDSTPVDLFFSYAPFHAECDRRAVPVSFDGRPIRVLSAEELAVCKALFDRPKDWVDIDAMRTVLGDAFDAAHVSRWLREIAGEEDSRTRRFEALPAVS